MDGGQQMKKKFRGKTHAFGPLKPDAIYSLCGIKRVWFADKPTCKRCKRLLRTTR